MLDCVWEKRSLELQGPRSWNNKLPHIRLPGIIVADSVVQWSIRVINQLIDQFEQVAKFSMSSPI